jgi:catechol 2,3-dioxygenase-like lactoylglutathione lyase family enzyme
MTVTFKNAWGYQGDNMNLPVANVDTAIPFYEKIMGFRVESSSDHPHRSAVLGRGDIQIGLAENGGDPTQDGCAFEVDDVEALLAEFKANGVVKENSDLKSEEHDGISWKVFYIVAPDGLCYWVGEKNR